MIGSVNLSKRVVQTRPTKEGLQPTQHCTTEHLKHLLRDSGAISAFLDGKGTIVHFDDNTGHQNNCQVHFEFLKYGENSKSEQNSATTQHSCFKNGSCASIFTGPWRQTVAFPPRQSFLFLYLVVNSCPETTDCSTEITCLLRNRRAPLFHSTPPVSERWSKSPCFCCNKRRTGGLGIL